MEYKNNRSSTKKRKKAKKKGALQLDSLSKALSLACFAMLLVIIGLIAAIGLDDGGADITEGTTSAQSTTQPEETETTAESTTESTTKETTTDSEYTEVNEKVYTTATLNVRTGPDTDYEKVGQLAEGTEVTRLAIGKNGWSKIIFEGRECFVASEYLTATKPANGTEIMESERIKVDPNTENWNLIVVNHTREIPEGYTPQLAKVAGGEIYMDYRVAPHYTEMYNAAKADGITLTPYSGYRSYDRQKRNYNNRINNNIANGMSREDAVAEASSVILPPGTSEHNLGLAMDICNTKSSFKNQKEYAWLVENAHKYGFILRYTEENRSVTGIVAEPWHWRYVGVEHAEKIKNSGLCLEEYLDSIGVSY